MKKQDEKEFASMCAHHKWWAHKWADIPSERAGDNPTGTIVDYLIWIGSKPAWVECKQEHGGRLNFRQFSSSQVRFMKSFMKRDVQCWLFLLMGSGRAPMGRAAYLIPWREFADVAKLFKEAGKKSMPWKKNRQSGNWNAEYFFFKHRLDWQGGWRLPIDHIFTSWFPDCFSQPEFEKWSE